MIDGKTRVYGVLGDPIAHSLSPVMHNAGFAHIRYNGVFAAFCVQDISRAVAGIRGLNLGGAAVTLPHKLAIQDHLDELDPMAQRIGAVNTVQNQEGTLKGYNSDWLGAMRALRETTPIQGKTVAVLGAGGAARAVGFGIRAEGGTPLICNRTRSAGQKLAAELESDYIPISEFDGACDILINTTPVGMWPQIDQTPVEKRWLRPEMTVMDIVYHPLKTRLLAEAGEQGCAVVDGLAMFVYQGAFQFELWTGQTAPVAVMRARVLECLNEEL